MFNEEFTAASKGAAAKSALLKKNPGGYFLLSMLAGAYIGFGILLVFTLSGALMVADVTSIAYPSGLLRVRTLPPLNVRV